jgi:hypothetical protein
MGWFKQLGLNKCYYLGLFCYYGLKQVLLFGLILLLWMLFELFFLLFKGIQKYTLVYNKTPNIIILTNREPKHQKGQNFKQVQDPTGDP